MSYRVWFREDPQTLRSFYEGLNNTVSEYNQLKPRIDWIGRTPKEEEEEEDLIC